MGTIDNSFFPWHLWQNPIMPDPAINAILTTCRTQTPLLQFLNRLLIPQLVIEPTWFTELKLDQNNIKLFLMDDAETAILSLFLDLTHRSFLQFCLYLVHDRLMEYANLRKLFAFAICPVIITLSAVQNAINSFLYLFEYRDSRFLTNSLGLSTQYRRQVRATALLHDAINQCMSMYQWSVRDNLDIMAFNKLLRQLHTHPAYTAYTYAYRSLAIPDLVQLRSDIFTQRYFLYSEVNVPPPPVTCLPSQSGIVGNQFSPLEFTTPQGLAVQPEQSILVSPVCPFLPFINTTALPLAMSTGQNLAMSSGQNQSSTITEQGNTEQSPSLVSKPMISPSISVCSSRLSSPALQLPGDELVDLDEIPSTFNLLSSETDV
jgi:hypothetical protein